MDVQGFAIVEDGTWNDITAFCEELSGVFDTCLPEIYDEFDAWRPKPREGPAPVRERTNDRETLQQTGIEQDSDGAVTEMSNAGRKMRDSGKDLATGHPGKGFKDMEAAGSATVRGLLPTLLRGLRRLEHRIYTSIVGRMNPDYFETGPVTVTIEHAPLRHDQYRVRVMFQEQKMLDQVTRQLPDL